MLFLLKLPLDDCTYFKLTGLILFYWNPAEYAFGILHWLGNRTCRDESRQFGIIYDDELCYQLYSSIAFNA